jgi:hypothetical protein
MTTPQSFLASHLKRLEGDVTGALRIFIERPSDATMQVLLSAVSQRNAAVDALAAVEEADTRIYDGAGRWTGMRRGQSFMAERPHGHQAAAAEPDSREPPKLATKRAREEA